jgi:hypothetical protein
LYVKEILLQQHRAFRGENFLGGLFRLVEGQSEGIGQPARFKQEKANRTAVAGEPVATFGK